MLHYSIMNQQAVLRRWQQLIAIVRNEARAKKARENNAVKSSSNSNNERRAKVNLSKKRTVMTIFNLRSNKSGSNSNAPYNPYLIPGVQYQSGTRAQIVERKRRERLRRRRRARVLVTARKARK